MPRILSGKYRLDGRVGSGGMGVVYRGLDLPLDRAVAVKTLTTAAPSAFPRFRREARAAAALLHPGIATLFSAESWGGIPMLIFEYLPGGTLAQRIDAGDVPIDGVVRWGRVLADALGWAHASGIVHRDVKPTNIGFTADGQPKLLDFGLSRAVDDQPEVTSVPGGESDGDRLTVSGHVVGTPEYLSPDALQGAPPDPAFDLWGLAVTLYEAVTGRLPFTADSREGTMTSILRSSPPDPRALRVDCPEPLARLLLDSLSREKQRRPFSGYEMASRLRGCEERPRS